MYFSSLLPNCFQFHPTSFVVLVFLCCFRSTETLEIFHIQEKKNLQSESKGQGNCEDFRSKHGIASGNLNTVKFYWFLFSNVQFQSPVSILEG